MVEFGLIYNIWFVIIKVNANNIKNVIVLNRHDSIYWLMAAKIIYYCDKFNKYYRYRTFDINFASDFGFIIL